MRFVSFEQDSRRGLAVELGSGTLRGRLEGDAAYPAPLAALISESRAALASVGRALSLGPELDARTVRILPPLVAPEKIICVGLNYREHAAESNVPPPAYPTIFSRFASGLVGHGAPLIRPKTSTQFDFEGELVAVIGRTGRHIPRADALDHVAGYSIFNDGSVRDIQLRTSQWTLGKNFDGTGAFGPAFVTADELPAGASGLKLITRLNGSIVQEGRTDDLIFDIATLVSELSDAMTLKAGDIIVTGTPSGVGMARTPPLFMKDGDLCEVEIEGIGTLVNPVRDEVSERLAT